jgi:hypothetical protein
MDQRTRHSQHPAIRFARGTGFGATLVRYCYGLSGCWPPCTDLTDLSANGGFYFQAFNGSVALPVAGYDYNSDWTPLLAGLSPAGMAASLAALARPCGARWSSERANVRAASMYSASAVERLRSGPRWVSARIQGLLPERPH